MFGRKTLEFMLMCIGDEMRDSLLIRQYIPKGTNINTITDSLITKIQKKINRRPREKLNFSTPVKELYKHYS